jgi:dipeptidyl aminopeptidase/acylaminoacyl peptidase
MRVTVAALAAVVLAAVGGIAAWNTQSDERSDDVVNNPDRVGRDGRGATLYFLDLDTGRRTVADGFTDATYAFSPDGSRVACSGRCFGTEGALLVANADGSDVVRLDVRSAVDNDGNPLVAEPEGFKWSPDGTRLLYQSGAGESYSNQQDLILHDVASNEASVLVEFGPHDKSFYGLGGFDFSPDGNHVLYSRPRRDAPCTEPDPEFPCTEHTDFDLWSVPTAGGDPTLVLRDAGVPGYLADGQGIVFVDVGSNAWNGGSISIFADGVRTTLAETPLNVWMMEMAPDRSQVLYLSDEGISVVDVATGEVSSVYGNLATWAGDDRLLVACVPTARAPGEEPTVDSCS